MTFDDTKTRKDRMRINSSLKIRFNVQLQVSREIEAPIRHQSFGNIAYQVYNKFNAYQVYNKFKFTRYWWEGLK